MSLMLVIVRNAGLLSIFAIVTATLLSITYTGTYDRIQQAQRQQEERALNELMQAIEYDNDLLSSSFQLSASDRQQLNLDSDVAVYFATLNNRLQAIIVPTVAVDGYSGAIRLLIGIDTSGRITGLRVTDHSETPGLGDKISLKHSDWVLGFDNLGFDNLSAEQWAVKKDGGQFDALTGATVTPRAVVNQAKATLELFAQRSEQWSNTIAPNQKARLTPPSKNN